MAAYPSCLMLILLKFIQLLKAMAVDDFLETAVGVLTYAAIVVENHHHTVFRRIRFPFGKVFRIGVAIVRETCPRTAHEIGQSEILRCCFRQLVF